MPKFNTIHDVWRKVKFGEDDECWPWMGKNSAAKGYGRMDVEKQESVYANRIAYLCANPGSITLKVKDFGTDLHVLHKCDNPPCCNPKHLFLGTHSDNMRDKKEKGRVPNFKGERGPRSKLTDEEAHEIRRCCEYGISTGELARLFHVSKPAIKDIKSGRSYLAH